MFRIVVVLLALPSMLCAQARLSVSPVPAGVIAPRVAPPVVAATDTRPAARLPSLVATDSSSKSKLLRYTLTGLGVGAAVGATGGVIGSRYAGCSCSDTELALWFAGWFGAIGAGAGAVVGTVAGLLHGR